MTLRHSGVTTIRVRRASLLDELESRIDSLLDILVDRELFNRDDREEVLCQPGPRARVRRVLDILECKGEEAALVFLSVRSHLLQEGQGPFRDSGRQPRSEGMWGEVTSESRMCDGSDVHTLSNSSRRTVPCVLSDMLY